MRTAQPFIAPGSASQLTANIWVSNGTSFQFAEQLLGLVPSSGATGVCFPGGGTRALTCALGQLRGLTSLGLIGDIDYISCVSGGSWAATAYTYYQSGASDDAQFLGPETPPADITMDGLAQMDPSSLGYTATQSLSDAIVSLVRSGTPLDQVWLDAIGQVFFQPFGLFTPGSPTYFSLSTSTVADIQQRNPSLASTTFQTVRTQDGMRPFLIINSTLLGPQGSAPFSPFFPESLSVFQYTPLYVGSALGQTLTYHPTIGKAVQATVGGGFVEPFAFGGTGPADAPASGAVTLEQPPVPFSLANASGASSSAFAAVFRDLLQDADPVESYWPVSSQANPATTPFLFGDGAVLENLGLLSLLQRQVTNIIVFLNTETKLSLEYDPNDKPGGSDIDSNLPPLFGFTAGTGVNNQVFAQSDWVNTVQQLQAAKTNTGTILAQITYAVQENTAWGIPGNWNVNILWVYNDRVPTWEQQIGDPAVQTAIDQGNRSWFPDGPFLNFPNYATVGQNGDSLIQLTPQQVNLLADLSCWNVTSNASLFSSFLGAE